MGEKFQTTIKERSYDICIYIRTYEEKGRKIRSTEKNCSFLAVTGCFSVPPDTGHERKVEVHVFVSPGPQLQLHACNDTRAQRGAQESGRGFGMQEETGEKGRRWTRAKNRARLSCTGTNFLLLSCARFVNPIAPKSLSRDYNFLDLCDLRDEKEDIEDNLDVKERFL